MFLSGSALAVFLLLLLSGVFNEQTQTVKANSPHNFSGWAWSDNVGWLSFNCSDLGTCGAVDYGVDVDANGILSGYAWSENIGWVSFNSGDLTGCPSGTCNARLNSTSGALAGWVKALSADGNGWDGFVSLSGASPAYGPVLNTTDPNNQILEGYAWGDEVVGWLKFDPWTGYSAKLSQPVCNANASCEAGLGKTPPPVLPTVSWLLLTLPKREICPSPSFLLGNRRQIARPCRFLRRGGWRTR